MGPFDIIDSSLTGSNGPIQGHRQILQLEAMGPFMIYATLTCWAHTSYTPFLLAGPTWV
jgi:hypothetical protein